MRLPYRTAPDKTRSQPSRNVLFDVAPGGARVVTVGPAASVQAFEDHRHALAAADAHGLQADRLVVELEAVQQRGGDPGPGHAERVPDGDRPAVHVQPADVDPQVTVGRDDLRRELLVDLHYVDVRDRHPGPPYRLP